MLDRLKRMLVVDWAEMSDPERRFVRRALAQFERGEAQQAIAIGFVFNAASFVLDRLIGEPEAQPTLLAARIACTLTIGALWLLRNRRGFPLCAAVAVQILLFIALYAWAVDGAVHKAGYAALKPVTVYVALAAYFVALTPHAFVWPQLVGFVASAGAFYAYGDVYLGRQAALLTSLSIALLGLARQVISVWNVARFRAEYATKILIAPAGIVALEAEGADVGPLLAPRERPCACVSFTIRGYERLVDALPPADLLAFLERHYEACDKALRERVTVSAYFCDVIAAEFFIAVFPAHEGAGEGGAEVAAREAFAFAEALVAAGASGAKLGDLDVGLDIGLAVGRARIGLMGPRDHKKTTALGEIPGRASRLRAAGALLAARLGPGDRIVVDKDGARALGGAGLRTLTLAEDAAVRDLAARELYYREREAA